MSKRTCFTTGCFHGAALDLYWVIISPVGRKEARRKYAWCNLICLLPHSAERMLWWDSGRKFGQTGASLWLCPRPECVRMKQEHNRFVGRFFAGPAALLLNLLFIKDARRERKKSFRARGGEKHVLRAAQRQLILHVALSDPADGERSCSRATRGVWPN